MPDDAIVSLLGRLGDVFHEAAEQAGRDADSIPQTADESNVRMHVRAKTRNATWLEAEQIVRDTAAARRTALGHGEAESLYDTLSEPAPPANPHAPRPHTYGE